MSTSPQRSPSQRSPRSAVAQAADATIRQARAPHAALGVPVLDRPASANEPHAAGTGAATTLDEVINGWGESTMREQLRWHFSTLHAVLSGAQQLGQAQAELSRQIQQRLEQLEGQLHNARNLNELATVQAALAHADFDAVMRFCHRLTELGTHQLLQVWQATGNGLVRLQSACWESALNWCRLQTYFGGDSDMFQAEVEHVLSPMAASPLVWPAQEAARQAAQMASQMANQMTSQMSGSPWGDWFNWSGRFADASRSLLNGGQPKPH
ncbi:hypothetical protein [Azohydromonas lata]|uniref:Phasin domain-containing protein n=1 Tax=Azohydromonas lata TaxID=45677 RepID=A0ABU5IC69_9BURK|nr:hypothetical protein [Azohydromonas lata]MDZ5456679.1 hypothetical protein [Azohydromonas lata]